MITLEEFLEHVRSGNISLNARYESKTGNALLSTRKCMFSFESGTFYKGIPVDDVSRLHQYIADEVGQACDEYQVELWMLAFTNDIAACYDPANHQPYYVPARIEHLDKDYIRCDECARIRTVEDTENEKLSLACS